MPRAFLLVGLVYVASALQIQTPCRFYASTSPGLEDVLGEELSSDLIGASEIRKTRGGVEFQGPDETVGSRALLWCRTANRVLELLKVGADIDSADRLFAFTSSIPWREVMGLQQTLSVDSVLGNVGQELSHSHFTSLTVKNAVCDHFRKHFSGQRPSVDRDDADLPLLVYISRGEVRIYRSLGGSGSLHKRGYRSAVHKAALRETVAAGCLARSAWEPGQDGTLIDPMCGSGTFPIEAALKARRVAPGLLKLGLFGNAPNRISTFPLQRWPDHDQDAFEECVADAMMQIRPDAGCDILANDVHAGAVSLTKADANAAGVGQDISVSLGPAASFSLGEVSPGMVISNPPWEKRIAGSDEAWGEMGTFLRNEMRGKSAWLLSGNPDCTKGLRMKASSRHPLSTGGVDLRLLHYTVLRPKQPEKHGSASAHAR